MSASAVAGVLACLLTLLLVPPVIRLCNRWQLLDRPGALKIHTQPIPRLGGVPLVIGISAAVLAVERSVAMRSWPFLAALALVWVAGLIDDVRSLSILFRLAAQFAAAAFLWRHGWVVPLSGVGVANLIATSIFVVAFVNAVNFLDGSDGLAAGVAAIIAIAFVLAGISSANLFHAVLAPAVAGACLGFLRYNLPPARAFLGDSGSTSLGLSIAFLSLDFWRSSHATPAALLFPLLVAALPLVDGALAIIRRASGGVSPLYGDRFHVSDRMLTRGWSPTRVALIGYAITIAFASVALWGLWREPQAFWIAAMLSVGVLVGWAVTLGCLRSENGRAPNSVSRQKTR
ncbi:MAG TPA: MraY family glycosyltransferase [Candidatus Acidoferrales bacterium]|nr:MraY family glycosyltransferase [Candidatus Acidoferrales bacterium]